MAEDKHDDAPNKVGGEAGSGAATKDRQDRAGDGKPAGVGPVDKKEEVEQQPT